MSARARIAPLAAALALGATLTLSGCGDDEDSGGVDNVTNQIEEKTQDGADKVEDAGKDAADKTEQTGEDAGDKAKDLGDDVEKNTD